MESFATRAGPSTEVDRVLEAGEETDAFVLNKSENDAGSREVFVVHGHDELMKAQVARFISRLDLKPIILREQPNEGRTIIDKFEQTASSAAFAVVLMSPDDIGASQKTPDDLKPRARQNVLVELGYFTAKLGRRRVCVLVRNEVEIPSDYIGVGYHTFDEAGRWELELGGELHAAGFEFPTAKLFGR